MLVHSLVIQRKLRNELRRNSSWTKGNIDQNNGSQTARNSTDRTIMTRASANFHLPGYELLEKIHHYSKSIVYRAKQEVFGAEESSRRPVIIKLLAAEYPSYQDLINFRHQYTIAKDLDLPGTLQIYSLEEHDRGYAIVMEDFGGIALDEYLPQLSLSDILEIGLQLTITLQSLSQRRIIHKDIKPANILIHPVTKQVKLIDFSIASLLPQETQELVSPNLLEGTLAYISPEQTGRMNRGIDYRSDFYSLGVTLYELLTGKQPFVTADPLELVHCHLAKIAVPVSQINPKIPIVVSQIVAKLMAKNAEDRYQSALGLRHDLEKCLAQWPTTAKVDDFELGQKDLSDRFAIPEKLYGRQTEVQTLLDAFTRVSQGHTEMMLVAGFSGIGKTVAVNEVHKPISRQQGYFIKGKYDQFNRSLPLSAFCQAFQDLVGQLLSESDAQLASWKSKILAAVGENGQILIESIPALEKIIGSQPASTELAGTAAQQRFNLLFQNFVEVFATAEHPLVMFLDDLQWADSASLQLIKLLMDGKGYLLLLGAYRDNEISIGHPLMLTIEELKQAEAIVQTVTLTPLDFLDTNQLVADTLHCSIELARPLSTLIDRKTQGNPFFTTQFLKSLQADGEITFNPAGYWECDIAHIQTLSLTNDVVELMVTQLQKLPTTAQEILKLAACIGNQFDLETLAIVSEQSQQEVSAALWLGLQTGLILPTSQVYKFFQSNASQLIDVEQSVSPRYRFLHDRVQQAAYSLIPADRKQHTHLQIGRLLLANNSTGLQTGQPTGQLFSIVNHFNEAIALIQDVVERQILAELNLQAAQKAKAATAYQAAFNYAQIGSELLGSTGWQTQYQITLALYETLAETAFLQGNLDAVPILVHLVLDQARDVLDRLKVYEIIIQLHTIQKQYQQAIDRGLEILQQLDIKLAPRPHRWALMQELLKTKAAFRGQSPEQLASLGEIAIPEKAAALRIMELLQMPAYLSSPKLMVLFAASGVRITLKYGNSPWAAGFYAHYCMILSSLGQLEQSYQIGQLAMTLADRYGDLFITAKVKVIIPWFSQPWRKDLRSSIPVMDESLRAAIDSGNLTFMGISTGMSMITRFFAGISLDEIGDRMSDLQEVVIQSKDASSQQYFDLLLQTIQQLRGKSLVSDQLDEISGKEKPFLSTMYGFQTYVAYLLSDIPTALRYADAQLRYESAETTGMTKIHIWLFDALTRLAAYPQSDSATKKQLLQRVTVLQKNLLTRAKLMPGNFQHKCDLIEAEKCRVLAKFSLAMELYDRAIAGAKAHKYLQEEALANELAAKFYLEWGKEKIAAVYLQEAYSCYIRWGATAKTDDLTRRYPQLIAAIIQSQQPATHHLSALTTITHAFTTKITSSQGINSFDLAAVIQSTQALSSIIELPALIHQLCQILMKNSGAEICIPILLSPNKNPLNADFSSEDQQVWQVYGADPNISVEVPVSINTPDQLTPLAECSFLPIKLINQVRNCSQTIILDQASLLEDDYLLRYQPKSVMCLPLLDKGKLRGMIYLESRHTAGIFNSDQQIVLEFIATQAVITLQNAQLYESLAQRSAAIESSTDGIAISDKRQLLYINHSYAEMFGYTVKELEGKSAQCLYSPEQMTHFQSEVSPILSTSGRWRGEAIGLRKNGETFDQELSLSLLPNGQMICVSRDITIQKAALRERLRQAEELKQVNKKLDSTNQELLHATRLKDEFLATMSHELRTPLNAIIGMSEGLQEEVFGALNEDQLNWVAMTEASGRHLLSLINDILDVSKIAAGKLELDIAPVNLISLCNSSLDFIKQQAAGKQIKIQSDILVDLASISVDERRIRQVLINLLSNAVKFTPVNGNVDLRISFKSPENGEKYLCFEVIDTGIGIAPEDQCKLFQPFIQIDSKFNRQYAGTGLGLAIVKQVVELHGGNVGLHSQVGSGSCFMVNLPSKCWL
jgi:PAS domain S-box-containing protein